MKKVMRSPSSGVVCAMMRRSLLIWAYSEFCGGKGDGAYAGGHSRFAQAEGGRQGGSL